MRKTAPILTIKTVFWTKKTPLNPNLASTIAYDANFWHFSAKNEQQLAQNPANSYQYAQKYAFSRQHALFLRVETPGNGIPRHSR